MNRILISIFTYFIFTSFVFGQNEQKIKTIRKTVESINIDTNYLIKKLDNDYFVDKKNEITDNGQELTGYYKNGHISKIVYYVGLSVVTTIYEFYFYEDLLIFVFEKQKTFAINKNGELNFKKLVPVFEGRYYFSNEKLIKTRITGNEMFARGNKENDLLSKSKSFVTELKQAK